jgi:hypothetical protein
VGVAVVFIDGAFPLSFFALAVLSHAGSPVGGQRILAACEFDHTEPIPFDCSIPKSRGIGKPHAVSKTPSCYGVQHADFPIAVFRHVDLSQE